jgi:HlyD family secretion protein
MTATADITVKQTTDVILVPNLALRFTPPATEDAQQTSPSLISRLFPRPPIASKPRDLANGKSKQQRVWVLRDGQPFAVAVSTGATDGVMTEITGGDITIGNQVVIDITTLQT